MSFQSRAKRKETQVQSLSCCWAAAPTISVFLSTSSAWEKQFCEEKDKHFALTGGAEGGEEAGRLLFDALNPIICRGIIKYKCEGFWNRNRRLHFLHALPWKLNLAFFCVIVPRAAYTENMDCLTAMTSSDTSLVQQRWTQKALLLIPKEIDGLHVTRTTNQRRDPDHTFSVVCIWYLFFWSNFIL